MKRIGLIGRCKKLGRPTVKTDRTDYGSRCPFIVMKVLVPLCAKYFQPMKRGNYHRLVDKIYDIGDFDAKVKEPEVITGKTRTFYHFKKLFLAFLQNICYFR